MARTTSHRCTSTSGPDTPVKGADVPHARQGSITPGTLISQCGTVAAGYLGEEYVGGEYAGTAAGANSGAVREGIF